MGVRLFMGWRDVLRREILLSTYFVLVLLIFPLRFFVWAFCDDSLEGTLTAKTWEIAHEPHLHPPR